MPDAVRFYLCDKNDLGVHTEMLSDGIMELARGVLGLKVEERQVDRSELHVSDEVSFTGTVVELAPITRVDHRSVGSGRIGPVTNSLRTLYAKATRGRLTSYKHWVLPVQPSITVRSDVA